MRKSEVQSSRDKSGFNPHHKHEESEGSTLDAEQRRRMIAEAAYFLAEHRGFYGGDPVQDWLVAEAEIDRELAGAHAGGSAETAAYLHLREEVGKALSKMQVIDAAKLKNAFEWGLMEVDRLEHFSGETIHAAAAMLREDVRRTAERMGPGWEHFSERSAGLFSVWKDRSREFLNRSADAVRDWLHHEHRGSHH